VTITPSASPREAHVVVDDSCEDVIDRLSADASIERIVERIR